MTNRTKAQLEMERDDLRGALEAILDRVTDALDVDDDDDADYDDEETDDEQ